MEKTRSGLSVGALGALVFAACLFGGYTVALLVVGYILVCEKDGWLRRTSVKAILIMVLFSLIGWVLNLIPSLFTMLNNILGIFDIYFYPTFISGLASFLKNGLALIKDIVFLVLAVLALKQKTVVIAPLENLISRLMPQ